ncbi:Mur ligase family protein [Chryseolinea sp. T2]|uniref:UDP-N-acetylmuramate--L-alanine ligase n=1 Tax=Chryseolinea sp. T2 TaxID=3129255 RepID=UPI003077AF2D
MHQQKQRVHFIAIGGSVMHNLAVSLKLAGHEVTGSDDEIHDPSRSTLIRHGLLPDYEGWNPDRITPELDAVILGMHARKDNPELLRAQSLGLKIYSFPEYIYEHSRNKQRVVIAGSHGKTTITAMVIHCLNHFGRKFDYVIGARVKGVEHTVKLSDAPIIVIEGDEYLSSALDPTPKLLRYQHHIGLISGVAWDHVNVFAEEEDYLKQFDRFADETPKGGTLIYCEQDSLALIIGKKDRADVLSVSYRSHTHSADGTGKFFITNGKEKYPVKVFGSHNFQNMSGAKEVLKKIGITPEMFFEAIQSFEGAAGRLEKVAENKTCAVFKDFAHAPSKVKATVKAVKEIFPSRDLVACLELHSFSSLTKRFLPQYKDSMKVASNQLIMIDPEKLKSKGLESISEADLKKAFNAPNLTLFTSRAQLESYLLSQRWDNKALLMMSSGTFGGLDLKGLASRIIS